MNAPFARRTFPSKWLDCLSNEIAFSVSNGLPGAVVSAVWQGEVLLSRAYGQQRRYNEKQLMPVPEPMREDTIFDLASLTKIFSTTLAFMRLVDNKQVAIDDTVCRYLPAFSEGAKADITIGQLLQHRSGLPSSFHFYDPKQVPPAFYSQCRDTTCTLLPQVPLLQAPDSVTLYSDLNFALLGVVLESITGMRQDQFVDEQIYRPLGLNNTGYRLLDRGLAKNRFEATERCGNTRDGAVAFPNIRTQTIQGEVHDELAYYAMGQVSGHAGLFSTAADLTVLSQLILNGGGWGSYRLCSAETVKQFTHTLNKDGSYALGFQIPTAATQLTYGVLLPEGGSAVAHTGWTGKCVVIDFSHQAIFLLLTNKKHSPVISLPADLNHFEGDLTPASIYAGPIQQLYAGLLSSAL